MVEPGVDRLLADRIDLVAGDRVGLLTNPSGVDSQLRPTVDRLYNHEDVDLRRLFGPEHGIRGLARAGAAVDHGTDEGTGLPVASLYGETRRPTAEMLADLDVLVSDFQDVGTRYYTLVYTLGYSLEAAAEHDVRFVVLDRPNPIAPLGVSGNRVPDDQASFVGDYRLPVTHGLTVGELARYIEDEYGIRADLEVVRMAGWSREDWYDDTGLSWVPPSPNMPTPKTAVLYPGTCLFEGTNISEGRGTTRPFSVIGAPWIDGDEWARTLVTLGLPGVRFRPTAFRPTFSKHEGEAIEGVQVHLTDCDAVEPLAIGIAMLVSAFQADGETDWRRLNGVAHIDRLAGGPALRKTVEAAGDEDPLTVVEQLRDDWRSASAEFAEVRTAYELY
jgi:uncharacterized protein YbbC (DUF1343 family)